MREHPLSTIYVKMVGLGGSGNFKSSGKDYVMAISVGSLVEFVINMRYQAQETLNVWQYEVTTWPGSVSAVQGAEGYWNHIKATLRALQLASQPDTFISIKIRELNNVAGDYAEYDVPTAEKVGTRANPAGAELLPPFGAAGVRLVVGSRLTRPGQKRYAFLTETDNIAGVLQSAYRTLLVAHMNIMTVNLVLGAPAATCTLVPIVTKKDATGFVTAHQNITGYLINGNITSQNSRKFGRGS